MDIGETRCLFVFGTLKQGFPNHHLNQAKLIDSDCQTLSPFPLYLVGERYSPWLIDDIGKGIKVTGELYQVKQSQLQQMDKLERIDRADGYLRRIIKIETTTDQKIEAYCYLKPACQLIQSAIKIGPLANYTLSHAKLYHSRL